MELSPPNFLDWQRESRTVEAMGAYTDWSANVLGAGEPIRLEGALVTWDGVQRSRRAARVGTSAHFD